MTAGSVFPCAVSSVSLGPGVASKWAPGPGLPACGPHNNSVRFHSGLSSWLVDFLVENSLNHKLRVLVRVDVLLRIQRLAPGYSTTLDFRDWVEAGSAR